jgi:hypothetical protein
MRGAFLSSIKSSFLLPFNFIRNSAKSNSIKFTHLAFDNYIVDTKPSLYAKFFVLFIHDGIKK